jgi:glycosyltransferase involved in cell wall biosynthesis
MRLYTPDACSASGYGRLAAACARALGSQLFSSPEGADLAITNPHDPAVAPLRFTMWESTELPKTSTAWRNAQVIIVPSAHSKKIFRQYSRLPIEVCPLFADAKFEHLPPARPFKFICVARDNGTPSRKGIDELIRWFSEAFPREADVSLTIKQSKHCKVRYAFDKRINIIYEDYERPAYHKLLSEHHCGIFLSGAEGWNLPATELMATGRPSILIPWGGPADFTTHETSWHLPYKLVQAPKEVYKEVGKVAFPDKHGTIRAMREAYEDQLLLAQKALASALRAADYTEARFAARLRAIVARYGFSTDFS